MPKLLMFHRGVFFWGMIALLLVGLSCGFNPQAQPAGWSGAAVSQGGVYIGSRNGKVIAFDPSAGEVKWQFPADERNVKPIYGTPAATKDAVYFGGGDRKIRALRAGSGEQIWEREIEDEPFADMTVAEGLVLVGTDRAVYALKQETGERVWRYETGSRVYSAPVVDAGKVYFGTMSGRVVALNLANGRVAWSFPPGGASSSATGAFASTPLVFNGRVLIGSFNRTFYSIDGATGAVRWQKPVGNWVWNRAVVFEDTVIVGSLDHKVYAFSVSTGTKKWDFLADGGIRSDPAVDTDSRTLVVADEKGKVYFLNVDTGLQRWEYKQLEASVLAPISIENGVAYIPAMNNTLYAVKIKSRERLWSKPIAVGGKG